MTRLKLGPITLHWGSKDGGPESRVYMYGIECKALASVLVLRFDDGSRDAYHSHAFNAISVILNNGQLEEQLIDGATVVYSPQYGDHIIITARERCHRVVSVGTTWVLSLRGPWAPTWTDIDGATGTVTRLRSGRVAV